MKELIILIFLMISSLLSLIVILVLLRECKKVSKLKTGYYFKHTFNLGIKGNNKTKNSTDFCKECNKASKCRINRKRESKK